MALPAALVALIPTITDFLLGEAKEVIDRTIPDKEAARQAKEALDAKRHDNSVTLAMQQILANVEEIKSGHILGKWRGALGWGLTIAALYQLAGVHFLAFVAIWVDPTFPVERLPKLELSDLLKPLLGMLGIV